ncbi:putative transposase-associated domain-containing protein [Tanacetum coccineum]
MDKSWMYNTRRSSRSFVSGVENFLDFAFERSSNSEGNILCPCSHCVNIFHHTRDDVFDHLICWGFRKGYSEWNLHGEGSTTSSPSRLNNEQEEIFDHDMHGLLNDIFHPTPPQQSIGSGLIGEGEVQMSESNVNTGSGETNGRKKFQDLLKDAEEKVYSNSKYSKLSCLVHLYHIKCLNGWSNKSFSMLLEFLRDLLPEGNLLPKTTYQVKKILANLGLSYEKIDACPNGCMLFWGDKDKEKQDKCSICNASRWKVAEDDSQVEMSRTKKKASKILRWFPLKPRLQRLFESSKTAALMKWHHEELKLVLA